MESAKAADPGQGRKTILVVDDEVLIRMALAGTLRAAGWTVVEAANADEALRILDAGMAIDLLITDLRMPGMMDGRGLVTAWRGRTGRSPVIVVSAEPREAALMAAVDGYFDKPFQGGLLRQRATELLS